MRALQNSDLLGLWEDGRRRHPIDRAILVLAVAEAGKAMADWPLGRLNRALIELHCVSFGRSFKGWLACPGCCETLEFQLDGLALANSGFARDVDSIVVNGNAFRLPTSKHLASIAIETSPERAAIRLLESLSVEPCDAESWSEDAMEEIGEELAKADPLAETRVSYHCPLCGATGEETLDIVSFLWAEIQSKAKRLFAEIHVLASTYGWTEREVLALGEERRAIYLEMARS